MADDRIAAMQDAEAPPFGTFAPTLRERWTMTVAAAMPDNWLCRQVASACRDIAEQGLTHPIDVSRFGQKMRLSPFKNVAARRLLFTPQFFDRGERELLAAHAGRRTGEYVFLDIGANVGGYSLYMASVLGARGRVLAFEPQPDVLAELRFNVAQNGAARIEVLPVALCDRDGEAELFIAAHNKGEASLFEGKGQAVKVPARTLLSVLNERAVTRVDAMKIDIEGAEDLALGPFLESADDPLLPALVVIEDSRAAWRTDVLALMENRGYRVTANLRQNFVLERQGSQSQ
jgi:FkbM family methyltransferase